MKESDKISTHENDQKRLHIKLNRESTDVTRIMIWKYWGGEAVAKSTLSTLWFSQGEATDIFYAEEFWFRLCTFSTHEKANQILQAVITIIKATPEGQSRTNVNQILSHLMINSCLWGSKRASWATANTERNKENKIITMIVPMEKIVSLGTSTVWVATRHFNCKSESSWNVAEWKQKPVIEL